MYREWDRDFRLCERDCKSAVFHLKYGTLFKWYEMKTQNIKSDARSMLSGDPDPDKETNMPIPTDLSTMERRNGSTHVYKTIFMTPHIANIVADVQQEENWSYNWGVLKMYFRDPETRVAAGKKFEQMFLKIFQTDPSRLPPCFELGETARMHPESRVSEKADMPWEGIGQQPTLEYISTGKDADGSLYSKKELEAVIVAAMDDKSSPIRLLLPCAQNWATWDAAVIYAEKIRKRSLHIIFLQMTINREHDILAKGFNQVRDAIPVDSEFDIYYHYILVLLVEDGSKEQIPKRRDVLVNSKTREKDKSWHQKNLRQYIMFVSIDELFRPLS
jgi:hypothetical protein